MKKSNIRKMAAFAAAFVLAAQSGLFVLNAEETKNISDEEFRKALYDSLYDKDEDGVLSDEELEKMYIVSLYGDKLKDAESFDFLEKIPNATFISIYNWEDFDFSILKSLNNKSLKYISLKSSSLKKSDEQFSDVGQMNIYDAKDFDLEVLSSFPNLGELCIYDSTVKDITVVEKLNIHSVYTSGTTPYKDYYKILKFPDIELPEGYETKIDIKPYHLLRNDDVLTIKDTNIAKAADSNLHTADAVGMDDTPYVVAGSAGKTEYEVKDKDGNLIGSGNITVVPDKPFDEPLVSEKLPEFKIIESNQYSAYIYILTENGELYSYNKEGKGEFTKIDDNVVNFFEYSLFKIPATYRGAGIIRGSYNGLKMNTVLYKDGVLKVDGKAVNDPNDYTIISSNEGLDYCLCSDGKIRDIDFVYTIDSSSSSSSVEFRVPEIICDADVKAITTDSDYCRYPICQLQDGRTVLFEIDRLSPHEVSKTIDLGLNITPVHAIRRLYDYDGQDKQFYYIMDSENDLYEVILADNGDEIQSKKIAEKIKNLGYIYDKNDISGYENSYVAYLGEDNEYHDPAGVRKFENRDRYMFVYDKYSYYDNPYYTYYTSALGAPSANCNELFSWNDSNCTEKFSCFGNNASMTHVKDTIGIFSDGTDYIILVTREDNTLWKYSIQANTFTRIDTEMKAATPKKYRAADIVSMMRFLCGIVDDTDNSWMDISGNGEVNVMDLVLLKKAILNGNSD